MLSNRCQFLSFSLSSSTFFVLLSEGLSGVQDVPICHKHKPKPPLASLEDLDDEYPSRTMARDSGRGEKLNPSPEEMIEDEMVIWKKMFFLNFLGSCCTFYRKWWLRIDTVQLNILFTISFHSLYIIVQTANHFPDKLIYSLLYRQTSLYDKGKQIPYINGAKTKYKKH